MNATVLDEKNSIVIEPSEYGFPPLLVVATGLQLEDIEHFRVTYDDAVKSGRPLLFNGDSAKFFQLIDGRWQRLD